VDELRDKLKRESAAKTPRKPKMDPLLLQAYQELKLEGRLPSDIRLHGYDIRTSKDKE
jgi:hypothetical protein